MKSRQRGMGTAALIGIVALVAIILVAAVGFMSYVSAHNRGAQLEEGIKATYKNNQNILASYSQKVMEVAQVPDMARDDLIKVAKAAMEGRYGADGSKAVFQAIQEQNPVVSEKLYVQIQQTIVAGRDEFKNNQTRLEEQKRVYSTALRQFWGGMFMRFAGYPTINLDDYKSVIIDSVEQAFKAGKEKGPIQLRPAATAP